MKWEYKSFRAEYFDEDGKNVYNKKWTISKEEGFLGEGMYSWFTKDNKSAYIGFIEMLTKFGEAGWELASVVPTYQIAELGTWPNTNSHWNPYTFFMKRPKE